MPALITERLTDFYGVYPSRRTVKLKGAVRLFKGALAALDSAGFSRPAGLLAAGGVRVGGVSSATYDNLLGADGAVKAELSIGVFKFLNHGADPVTDASVGADCFVVDDQTVALTNGAGTRYVAGKVQQVEADGVRVMIGA